MMGRLRLANESRDEALLKLRTLETSAEGWVKQKVAVTSSEFWVNCLL